VPPRVEYELTELGRDLSIPIAALGQWAQKNRSRIEAARAAFDRRAKESAVAR
jgi:DNA-binding HxlR family transcriptional regulator